ncbi:recombinase family protein [Cytobacillus firmus]|uniref:recombinase family protein n=1 Tax=Cytobacillus firmus TaxID=1399 RepID=UPI0036C24494
MTVGIYIRVSTLEQAKEGYSIAAQKERLLSFCESQGWKDFRFYIDEGVSAKDTNRPQLRVLLDHVKSRKISTILVYRLDRFTRKVKDLHKMLEFLEEHKCAFKSSTEPYDTSSAMGKLFITIVAALAEWETDNLSERVVMALEEKVSSGERVGGVPYGFDLNKEEKLVKNDKAPVVLDMIDKVKKGMSASKLASYLNKTNDDRIWHPQGVLRILRNPALYGATYWKGKVYENTHPDEAIISKEEFERLQDMLQDRSVHHRRDVKANYLFQGVLICPDCNRPLSVNRYVRKRKDGSQYQSAVYRCQNCWKKKKSMVSIGESRFLDALKDYMANYNIDEQHFNKIDPVEEDERETILKELQQIEKMREKYQRAWAKDKMTDEEFDKRMDETLEVYEELKRKLEETKAPASIDTEALKEIVTVFNENFFRLTQEEKRMFVSQFIKNIEYKLVPQPPQRPDRHKKGKDLVVITHVEFY